MSLDKQDLVEIKKIVDGVVTTAIEKSEIKMSDKIEFAIEKSELRMEEKIEKSKDEILQSLHNEVSAMTEMHSREDERLDGHESRITKIEKKLSVAM